MRKHRRLRHILAGIARDSRAMARPHTIRLREAKDAPSRAAQVIDVPFREVGASRRTIWGRVKLALIAVFWAALIGFLVPPLWILAQRIGEQFAVG